MFSIKGDNNISFFTASYYNIIAWSLSRLVHNILKEIDHVFGDSFSAGAILLFTNGGFDLIWFIHLQQHT